MDYSHLTAGQAEELRHRRVLDLEIDHYRVKLALEEDPGDEKAYLDLAELERRIELHRAELGIVLPPLDGVGPEMPDTPGSGDVAPAAAAGADPGPMTTAYEDGPHESDPRPEGLETKAVNPDYASTSAHPADGGGETGGETGLDTDAGTGPDETTGENEDSPAQTEHGDGEQSTSV